MRKMLILISHGDFAVSLKKSTEIITGPLENVKTVTFEPTKGEEKFSERLNQLVDQTEKAVIFADLMGGTPSNVAARLVVERENVDLYTGMNMPMVIAFVNSEMIGKPFNYIENGTKGIQFLNDVLTDDDTSV